MLSQAPSTVQPPNSAIHCRLAVVQEEKDQHQCYKMRRGSMRMTTTSNVKLKYVSILLLYLLQAVSKFNVYFHRKEFRRKKGYTTISAIFWL